MSPGGSSSHLSARSNWLVDLFSFSAGCFSETNWKKKIFGLIKSNLKYLFYGLFSKQIWNAFFFFTGYSGNAFKIEFPVAVFGKHVWNEISTGYFSWRIWNTFSSGCLKHAKQMSQKVLREIPSKSHFILISAEMFLHVSTFSLFFRKCPPAPGRRFLTGSLSSGCACFWHCTSFSETSKEGSRSFPSRLASCFSGGAEKYWKINK